MFDKLTYRNPGESVVNKRGHFYELTDVSNYNGFLISNFDQSKYYGFKEEEELLNKSILATPEPFCISKEGYLEMGNELLNELKNKHLDKVILSRVLCFSEPFDQELVFDKLERQYASAFVYKVESSIFGTWMGATPELLLEEKGGEVSLVSLAGTKSADDDSAWQVKERKEQEYVTDYIEQCLIENHLPVKTKSEPFDHFAGPVKHLKTTFTIGNVKDKISLLKSLHPTPAVCGIPKETAKKQIKRHEKHPRELYAGMIGEMGQGCRLFVNLRCMQVVNGKAYLYVGGGYTKDSNPELEWEETEKKANTLLNILKND